MEITVPQLPFPVKDLVLRSSGTSEDACLRLEFVEPGNGKPLAVEPGLKSWFIEESGWKLKGLSETTLNMKSSLIQGDGIGALVVMNQMF